MENEFVVDLLDEACDRYRWGKYCPQGLAKKLDEMCEGCLGEME